MSHFTLKLRRRAAFTLIELLMVIGIVVVLLSISFPLVIGARKQAERTRTAADLQSIGQGLEAYRADFGDYPRVTIDDTGAAILGKTMLGIGDANSALNSETVGGQAVAAYSATAAYQPGALARNGGVNYLCIVSTAANAPPNVIYWIPFSATFTTNDGADGLGFKTRLTAARVYGPYLSADKFKWNGMDIVDANGNPVLYFPSAASRPAISAANGFVIGAETSLYDTRDNLTIFRRLPAEVASSANAIKRIQLFLGDFNVATPAAGTNCNGQIDAGETAAYTGPYILWTAGRDGLFGTDTVPNAGPTSSELSKCDDVTNFK